MVASNESFTKHDESQKQQHDPSEFGSDPEDEDDNVEFSQCVFTLCLLGLTNIKRR